MNQTQNIFKQAILDKNNSWPKIFEQLKHQLLVITYFDKHVYNMVCRNQLDMTTDENNGSNTYSAATSNYN